MLSNLHETLNLLPAGNLASKFVAGALYETLINYLPNLNKCPVRESQTSSEVQSGDNITPQLTWKDDIRANITIAFEDLHERFLETVVLAMPAPPPNHVTRNKTSNGPSTASPPPNMDQSGTTATVLLVTDSIIVVAGLGDSRAVLSSFRDDDNTTISGTDRNTRAWRDFPSVVAIQLTIDHVASDPAECDLVIAKGGSVMTKATTVGAIPRVNGSLAITRSIGDASLSPVLSREPYVISLDREELRDWCGRLGNNGESWWGDDVVEFSQIPCFVVSKMLSLRVRGRVVRSARKTLVVELQGLPEDPNEMIGQTKNSYSWINSSPTPYPSGPCLGRIVGCNVKPRSSGHGRRCHPSKANIDVQ